MNAKQIDACVVEITEAGKGRAVHMGVIAWAASETLNRCTNPEGPGVNDVQGEFVMTAANGDEVFGRYISVSRSNFETGGFTFAGHWRIVGGRGRFEHATGEGTLSGEGCCVRTPPIEFIATFAGKISY